MFSGIVKVSIILRGFTVVIIKILRRIINRNRSSNIMSQMTDREMLDCECRWQQQQCHVIVRRTTAICSALILTYDIVELISVLCLKWKICTAGDKIDLRKSVHFCHKCKRTQKWNNIVFEKKSDASGRYDTAHKVIYVLYCDIYGEP